jgi:hypothetical protein
MRLISFAKNGSNQRSIVSVYGSEAQLKCAIFCLVSGLRRVGGRVLRPGIRRLLRDRADRLRIHAHRQRDLHHRSRIQQQQQSGQPSLCHLFYFFLANVQMPFDLRRHPLYITYTLDVNIQYRCQFFLSSTFQCIYIAREQVPLLYCTKKIILFFKIFQQKTKKYTFFR